MLVKNENKIEFAAIPIVAVTLGILFVLFLAYDQGLWAWLVVGALGILLAALVARSAARRNRHPSPQAAPSAAAVPAAGGTHRVLVVADESVTSAAFRDAIAGHAGGRPVEAFVVAPALSSRLARWTGDEGAYNTAQEHLDATVAALSQLGVGARGAIGPHDPLQAADDGLRGFHADEIIFATHAAGDENWLEQGVVEQARTRYEIPVTHIAVEAERR